MKKQLLLAIVFVFLAGHVLGQYDSLLVGQTSGDSVHHFNTRQWLQVHVPSGLGTNTGSGSFDLNGDGTNDLNLRLDVWNMGTDSLFAWVVTLNGAQVLAQSGSHFVDSLNVGDTLLASHNWLDTQNHVSGVIPLYDLYRRNLNSTTDVNSGEQHFALRFPVEGEWMYAWLRYNVNGYDTHWGHIEISEYVWKGDANLVDAVEPTELQGLQLFPNPGTGLFWLQVPGSGSGKLHVEVFDVQGKLVQSADDIPRSGRHAVDLRTQPAGLYNLRIRLRNEVMHKKLIKM